MVLPYDVVCLILDHSRVDDYDIPKRARVSTWASAARVSQSWTAPAKAILYRHADLTAIDGGQPNPWVSLYVRTMRTCPHLRALVRILHIATRENPYPELYGWISLLPSDSLAFLDHSWERNRWDRSDDSFHLFVLQAPAVRTVRKLQICGSYSPTVLVFIMTLSRLEELIITIDHLQDFTRLMPTPTPRLKHLDITINPTFSAASFDLLRILVTAPRLEVLTIRLQTLGLYAYEALSWALRSSTTPALKQFGLYGNFVEWTELEFPFMDNLIVQSPSLEVVSCHQGTFTYLFFRHLPPTVKVLNLVIPSPTSLSDKCRKALIHCLRDARKRELALSRVFVWPMREEDSLYDIMSDACHASGITFLSQK
ncbi:hypothetical protein C8T65DRAFT_79739 [Cerioporus squamosus]|nr:hypothetical protein C8T65DRAFT_79739 [Cerioporus squamosus]